MATTDHPRDVAPAASDLAAQLTDAAFVRVVAAASGDALAASGLLVAAIAARDVPFQVSVVRTREDADRRLKTGDPDDVTVAIGCAGPTEPNATEPNATEPNATESGAIGIDSNAIVVPGTGRPASVTAAEARAELGADPDPVLALAGVVATGGRPDDYPSIPVADDDDAPGRMAGVGIPTADLADGLAHTTLVHASFSGDELAAGAALAELADDDPRTVASLLVFETVGTPEATPRAGEAIERALRPHATPGDRFETVEGYADVLDCVARAQPGTGLALAFGRDVRVEALEAWREHARAAHETLRTASTNRYDGLYVARCEDAPVETVARLLRDFRSPEPVALVLTDGEAGVAAVEDRNLGAITNEAAMAVDGTPGATDGAERRGYARFACEPDEFLTAFRQALEVAHQ